MRRPAQKKANLVQPCAATPVNFEFGGNGGRTQHKTLKKFLPSFLFRKHRVAETHHHTALVFQGRLRAVFPQTNGFPSPSLARVPRAKGYRCLRKRERKKRPGPAGSVFFFLSRFSCSAVLLFVFIPMFCDVSRCSCVFSWPDPMSWGRKARGVQSENYQAARKFPSYSS